jgi:radical SAM protein with 4Fe4S-binding SPASM domain
MHKPITYAYLETTNYCNLSCTFCNRDEVVKKLKHMSLTNWKLVLEKLKDQPIKEAKLMGLGEPFLHPEFSTICKMFKDYFPNAFLIVATNCQYKMNDNFKESLKYIDLLYLSIDGYKESYEKFRPPSKWSKLIAFLDEIKKVNRYSCRITCNYVVNTENIDDISKVKKHICDEYDLEELRLNIAQDWSEDKSLSNSDFISGYSSKQINFLKENYSSNIKGKAPWIYSDCFWVNTGIYMTVEGNLKVCALNTDTESLGNIFKDPVEEILNSKKMNEIRDGCNNNSPAKHCNNCSYKELSPILEKLIS